MRLSKCAARSPLLGRLSSHDSHTDITSELTFIVTLKTMWLGTGYLQAKVSRLSKHPVADKSRTIIRNLAKDGSMDDAKEDSLERKYPGGQQSGIGR